MPASRRSALLSTTPKRRHGRRRRLARLAAPLGLLAVVAFGAGAFAGGGSPDEGRVAAQRFAAAWERGDYAAMHAELSPAATRRATVKRLTRTYDTAAGVATVERVRTGPPVERSDGAYEIPVALDTRIFGTRRGRIRLPISGKDDRTGVDWTAQMAFPGLRPGERLSRETDVAPRAAILARNGAPLAEGPDRVSELGPLAAEVVGRTGPMPPELEDDYAAKGIPDGTQVGLNGLEREFDERLLGTPGGTLRAGERTLARVEPKAGRSVRTSIDPEVQRAAVDALAGRLGGIAVLKPGTSEVLALAGIAYSAPQPPGSTFKIITLAGSLKAGTVKRSATYPPVTSATIEGVELENANGEVCGGTLAEAFAESCNSAFAPMGVDLGAERLVAAAEEFGFNEDSSLKGAARSTIPPADEIGDDLAVGSSAIGQGKVLATPVAIANVAATIAEDGRRTQPSLLRGGARADVPPDTATTRGIARTITRYMRKVVAEGTGTAAAIPGVSVAGKTGTAELRNTTEEPAVGQDVAPGEAPAADTTDTTAWFTAFAPSARPRVAVAVMLVGQGAGGETAAPAAKQVLLAALKR